MSAGSITALEPEAVNRLRTGAALVLGESAVFAVQGPGAVECLQGILTNDVVRPGPQSLVYGAALTPKGMVLVDFWALRRRDGFILIAPAEGRAAALELFGRQFPPRLARVRDLTGGWQVGWLVGAQVPAVLERAGLPFPSGENQLAEVPAPDPLSAPAEGTGDPVLIARPQPAAPWAGIVAGPRTVLKPIAGRLEAAGAGAGSVAHLEALRILAGWPALGREIGEKTLPQEVRFDAIGGVSYVKGCYVGQETVARLHFRGHPNRALRGLAWQEERVEPGAPVVTSKEVGTLTSVLEVGSRRYGLAVLRREVTPGARVSVGRASDAAVVELPFGWEAN